MLLVGPPPEYDEHPGQFFYPPVGYHHVTSHVHVPVHTYQPVMSTTMVELFRALVLLVYNVY